MDLSGIFSTFIEIEDNCSICSQNVAQHLAHAIHHCRTCVTRGPVLHWTLSGDTLTLSLLPGLTPIPETEFRKGSAFFLYYKNRKRQPRHSFRKWRLSCISALHHTFLKGSCTAALSSRVLSFRTTGFFLFNRCIWSCFFLNNNILLLTDIIKKGVDQVNPRLVELPAHKPAALKERGPER